MNILVTASGPFGGRSDNASSLALRGLLETGTITCPAGFIHLPLEQDYPTERAVAALESGVEQCRIGHNPGAHQWYAAKSPLRLLICSHLETGVIRVADSIC